MKKKLLSTFVLLLFFVEIGLTQTSVVVQDLPVSISYFAENGIHPGLKLETYYTFKSKLKSKQYRKEKRQNKYGDKRKLKEFSLSYNLGFYSHPNNHTGVFSNVGLMYLKTKLRKRRQLGFVFEVGYLRRFNKLKTYELAPNGEIHRVRFAGNNALQISLAPIIGREIQLKENSIRIYGKPIVQLVQYNHSFFPNASFETGVVFNIKRKID